MEILYQKSEILTKEGSSDRFNKFFKMHQCITVILEVTYHLIQLIKDYNFCLKHFLI